jgi:hypothetical protein
MAGSQGSAFFVLQQKENRATIRIISILTGSRGNFSFEPGCSCITITISLAYIYVNSNTCAWIRGSSRKNGGADTNFIFPKRLRFRAPHSRGGFVHEFKTGFDPRKA